MEQLQFESILSPEDIEYYEKNNTGYPMGVSTDGKFTMHKIFNSSDPNNKTFRTFTMMYNEFLSGRPQVKPYRITKEDGTYKSPVTNPMLPTGFKSLLK